MRYWIMLGLAILTEVTGTLSMKWASESVRMDSYVFMLFMITLSYLLLSFAIKHIDLGVAYALWEGIGITVITLFSVLFFNEALSLLKVIGLTVLITGIILIKTGIRKNKNQQGNRYVAT